MAEPKKLDVADLRAYAVSLDMDTDTFDKVIADANVIDEFLSDDLAMAKKCNVRGTPAVYINGLKLQSRSISGYKKRIKQILGKAKIAKTKNP